MHFLHANRLASTMGMASDLSAGGRFITEVAGCAEMKNRLAG